MHGAYAKPLSHSGVTAAVIPDRHRLWKLRQGSPRGKQVQDDVSRAAMIIVRRPPFSAGRPQLKRCRPGQSSGHQNSSRSEVSLAGFWPTLRPPVTKHDVVAANNAHVACNCYYVENYHCIVFAPLTSKTATGLSDKGTRRTVHVVSLAALPRKTQWWT